MVSAAILPVAFLSSSSMNCGAIGGKTALGNVSGGEGGPKQQSRQALHRAPMHGTLKQQFEDAPLGTNGVTRIKDEGTS
jgi:hypothetical protein